MKTRTFLIIGFFSLISLTCRREKDDFIDISKVNSIEILKIARPEESTVYLTKKLSDYKLDHFVKTFNGAETTELRKFLPSYEITVHFIDKTARVFSTTSRFIKEERDNHYTDKCLDLDADNYFDKLYQD